VQLVEEGDVLVGIPYIEEAEKYYFSKEESAYIKALKIVKDFIISNKIK
jgi:hypothetical protein